jgi:hypothetical protein
MIMRTGKAREARGSTEKSQMNARSSTSSKSSLRSATQ